MRIIFAHLLFFFNLFSRCFREADRISIGVKHLDPIFWLFTSDSKHTEAGQSSWRELHNRLV